MPSLLARLVLESAVIVKSASRALKFARDKRTTNCCRIRMSEEIIDFSKLEPTVQTLIRKSVQVREHSYSPYSKFKVGASILCDDGTIFTGCNVENASYSVTTCAERTAIVKAVSEGKRKFKALAVVGKDDTFVTPCGFCRQAIAEFGDIPIYMSGPEMGDVLKTTLTNLLPRAFGLGATRTLE